MRIVNAQNYVLFLKPRRELNEDATLVRMYGVFPTSAMVGRNAGFGFHIAAINIVKVEGAAFIYGRDCTYKFQSQKIAGTASKALHT